MSYNARQSFSGGTDEFTFSFPYLEPEHIKVYIDGAQTLTFQFQTTDTIKTQVPVDAGSTVEIRRETPTTRLVDYTDGNRLRAVALDKDSKQPLYVAEELEDIRTDLTSTLNTVQSDLDTAETEIDVLQSEVQDVKNALVDVSEAASVYSVGNIQGMMNIPNPFDGMRVYVMGFYADYLIGGGMFVYVGNVSRSSHNGGTIIDPEHSKNPGQSGWWSSETSFLGCWLRVGAEDTKPEWFGAYGNGIYDDADAINATIKFVMLNGGGIVRFQSTTYRVDDEIGLQNECSGHFSLTLTCSGKATFDYGDVSSFVEHGIIFECYELDTIIVENIEIAGKTKVVKGISIREHDEIGISFRVRGCRVTECRGPLGMDNSESPTGIEVWGAKIGEVSGCDVSGIDRVAEAPAGFTLSCAGIAVIRCDQSIVKDNMVKTVVRNGHGDLDADGIKVFSPKDGDVYQRSNTVVSGNSVIDCEGRWVKLQTAGIANVSNNYFAIEGALELTTSFNGIDSQRGDTTIRDNRFFVGRDWTGGVSSALVQFQPTSGASIVNNLEPFFHRFLFNQAYLGKRFDYGIVPTFIDDGVIAKQFIEIKDNIIETDHSESSSNPSGEQAVGRFIYINKGPTVANFVGEEIWQIDRNHVFCDRFIHCTSNTQHNDFADKWYLYVRDNTRVTHANDSEICYAGKDTGMFTSTCCFARNHTGADADLFTWPINLTKTLNGFDVYTGDTTMTGVPSTYTYSRVWHISGHYGVDRPVARSISWDGTDWYVLNPTLV